MTSKIIIDEVLVVYPDKEFFFKGHFRSDYLFKNHTLHYNNLQYLKILFLDVKLFIQSTPQHLY